MLILYPYFFSKINRFDSLGPLSVVDEKSINIQKTIGPNRTADQFDVHLLKGERLRGEITASENNFGILLVRFSQLSAKVSDIVTFRIREKGEKKWYYENNYKADQFQPNEYFTFGFPSISDSKDKTYLFEVESLAGTYKNGIGLSPKKPQVALVYKYAKEDLKNFDILPSFIYKKLIYAIKNANFLENWQLLIISLLFFFLVIFVKEKKIKVPDIIRFFQKIKNNRKRISRKITSTVKSSHFYYIHSEKKTILLLRRATSWFASTKFYSLFMTTSTKKRLVISLLIFLIAFTYRFSATLVDQLGVTSFYAGLGGQSDYDQFIRAATCAVRSFCPAILGQNFLIESIILGIFYEIFGFTGGLKAYLYLMLILSSIVATLPYVLLSRKNWITVGGIVGGLFLATSDFLTYVALNLPPDNGSLFTFSMFFIVYLLTINIGTIRWLLFFGAVGTIDGLNKLFFLVNDLAAFMLFVPVFFYEKANKIKRFPFVKLNLKLIFYSVVPLLVFLVLYSGWEYIVQIKFSVPYYLRALIEGGSTYASSTIEGSRSIYESLSKGNVLWKAYYYGGLSIVMLKKVIQNAGLNYIFLTAILFGLLFATFRKPRFFITKLISIVIFSAVVFVILELFRQNYLGIQDIGQYVYAWDSNIYFNIFLFASIIFLVILNFKYKALKLSLPIIPYVIMLIILTKNAPWERLWVHVIAWSIILLSFLIDWILSSAKANYALKRFWIGSILLALFIFFYTIPKTSSMIAQLYSGINNSRNEVKYLRWVNSNIPVNSIVLLGGKSDLVTVAQNLKKPIVYNSLWPAALLIKPKEIPGAKPTDFAILSQLKINEIPGVTPSDFSIIQELKNKDNFKRNKYLILEDDIYVWRGRLAGVGDSVFSTTSATLLHADDYSIKVYKSNSALNKSIYELKLNETENL